MTLAEWTVQISAELEAAGFAVSQYDGLPLVPRPESHHETVRLLNFQTSLACDRRIYSEGMLFAPLGSYQLAEIARAKDRDAGAAK